MNIIQVYGFSCVLCAVWAIIAYSLESSSKSVFKTYDYGTARTFTIAMALIPVANTFCALLVPLHLLLIWSRRV